MKIITWNVNGIRPRLEQTLALLEQEQPDVLCLQEIKIANEQFPVEAFESAGYGTVAVHGQKAYHGVAIIAKEPDLTIERQVFAGKDDRRHIAVRLPNGLEVHNFYVPAGGDVPDRDKNEKFAQKLDFLNDMTTWFPNNRTANDKIILVGDLNVAPLETDVWNHKQQRKYVGHTPLECERFQALWESFGWIDVGRRFIPPEEMLHSWWTYRSPGAFDKGRGWRLDHVMASPALSDSLASYHHLTDWRRMEKPSDHLPVAVTLAL